METSSKFTGYVDLNEIKLYCTDTKLNIEVTNPDKLSILKKEYSSCEEIKKISSNHLESPLELFEALKAAVNSTNSQMSLKLDDNSNSLVYKAQPFSKVITMIFKLEPAVPNETEKFEFFLKRIGATNAPRAIIPKFSSRSYKNEFTISDDQRTITYNASDGSWRGILAERLNKQGRQRFSIKLRESPNNGIMVGVGLQSTDTAGGIYTKATGWMFCLSTGQVYACGGSFPQPNTYVQQIMYGIYQANSKCYYKSPIPIEKGDTITTMIDMDTLMLSFELNGILLGPAARLNITGDQLSQLCPALDFNYKGMSVTVI